MPDKSSLIGILVAIFTYWFFLAIMLTYVNADDSIQELRDAEIGNNVTWNVLYDTDDVNVTGLVSDGGVSIGDFMKTVVRMFTYSLPTSAVPSGVAVFLSFINTVLIIVGGIVVYRLALPTA